MTKTGERTSMTNHAIYTHRSASEGQTRAQTKKNMTESTRSRYHYVPDLGKKPTGQYYSRTSTVSYGWRLNKPDVLCASRQVDVTPPDAKHFHSGTVCCTVQSGLGPEVSLFTSAVPETKERWERGNEHSEEHIIIPGDCDHKKSRKSWIFALSEPNNMSVALKDAYP